MPIRPEMKARYPKDWKLRSRFIRHYRAKDKCEWCGAENGKIHPKTGAIVVLTVAHIHDERPEACSFFNLAALCQKCHNGHDAKSRKSNRIERRDKMCGQGHLFEMNSSIPKKHTRRKNSL